MHRDGTPLPSGWSVSHHTPPEVLALCAVWLPITPFHCLLCQGLNLGPYCMLGKCFTRDLYRQPEEQVVYIVFQFKVGWGGGLVGKALRAQA